jgi:GDP-4-dehydro-6-deoxy-D-mannose reductase
MKDQDLPSRKGASRVARALITGLTGFAGSHLAAHLLQQGDEVYGVALDTGHGLDFLDGPVSMLVADLQNSQVVDELMTQVQPDHIYHLAAQANVPAAWQDPWSTFENNVRPELNILQAMVQRRSAARLLVVASNEIYGIVSADNLPVDESKSLEPTNPYGVSKVAQDLLARQYFLSHRVDVIRVRAFNHLGPRQSPQFVAASFARQIAEAEAGQREPIMFVGNLSARRDFTDVVDVVRAYALLVQHGEAGEAYNVGSGVARSAQELLDILLGMSTVPIEVVRDPARSRPIDIPVIYANVARLEACTGWHPTISFEESLRRVLTYWREVVAQPGYVPEQRKDKLHL